MLEFLSGATTALCLLVAYLFFRSYEKTKDRLLAIFGWSFVVFAINRVVLTILDESHAAATWVYLSRLAAFVLILVAIIDKNLGRRRAHRSPSDDEDLPGGGALREPTGPQKPEPRTPT